MLIVQVNAFTARGSTFWFHNLYFRASALSLTVEAGFVDPLGALAISNGNLYLSSLTFQGEITPANATTTKIGLPPIVNKFKPVSMGQLESAEEEDAKVLMSGAPGLPLLLQQGCHGGSVFARAIEPSGGGAPVLPDPSACLCKRSQVSGCVCDHLQTHAKHPSNHLAGAQGASGKQRAVAGVLIKCWRVQIAS